MTRFRAQPSQWVVALALTLAAATGCAGSGRSVGEAVVAGSVARAATLSDAYVAFADCMRKRGFHVEVLRGGGVKIEGSDEGLHVATKACAYLLPAAHHEITPAEAARFRSEMLTFVGCIREHGVDLPDPKFVPLPGGFDVYFPRNGDEPPPQADSKWKAAEAACRHLNPLLRGHD
jgi:hypothetical protein